MTPPLQLGKHYSFTLHTGRVDAQLVELGDPWLVVKLAKGDRGWLRLSSLLAISETEGVRPRRNPDMVAWDESSK